MEDSSLIEKKDKPFIIEKNTIFSKKIVGMVLYASDNYGSCATNMALCEAVKTLGYTPILLNSYVPLLGVSASYLTKHFHCIADILPNNSKYNDLNKIFDKFILGSDYSLNIESQHTVEYIEYFLMAFANEEKIKIAYASSLGKPDLENDDSLYYLYSSLLHRFQLVTFREQSAVELSEKYLGIQSYNVLDPVFLLDKEFYYNVSSKNELNKNEEKPFLLAYILDYNYEKQKLIKNTADELNLDYKIILDRNMYKLSYTDRPHSSKIVCMPTFEGWLDMFIRSSFIVTDSFHGTCFAQLFHKKYISVKNRNTLRFDSLAHLSGYRNIPKKAHIYENVKEAMNDTERFEILDFNLFDRNLAYERDYCYELLRKGLTVEPSNNLLESVTYRLIIALRR